MQAHEVLKAAYARRRKKSRATTLRTIAAKIGVSASFLSQMFSGKRAIPVRLLDQLIAALELGPAEQAVILRAAVRGRSSVLTQSMGPTRCELSDRKFLSGNGEFVIAEAALPQLEERCVELEKEYLNSEASEAAMKRRVVKVRISLEPL